MANIFTRLLPRSWRREGPVIPVVRLSGAIGGTTPFRPGLALAAVADPLRRAFGIRHAPAVAIVINSPGGAPVQSHLIFARIRALAEEKEKRVLVFVEDVAASGGYMLALAGDEIVVDPASIVGSIGVVSAGFGFQRLIEKVGIERRVHTAGTRKVMLDPFQPERESDVAHLEALQREVHESFIDLVRTRRLGKLKDDPEIFSGAFWSGRRAVELGLADAIGDLHTVLRERFGKDVVTVPVGAPSSMFWWRRRGAVFGAREPNVAALVDQALVAIEERALWSRFGL